MENLSENGINREEIRSFLLEREQPEGGFSFAKTTPPTLEDTYSAILTLKLLGFEYKNKKTFDYLNSIDFDSLMIKHMFQLSVLLGTDEPIMRKIRDVIMKENVNQLDDYYYKLMLMQNLGLDITKEDFSKVEKYFPEEKKYLTNLFYEISIRNMFGEDLDKVHFAEKVNLFQNSDGGFGIVENATSFLEHLFMGVRSLSQLGMKPKYPDRCEQFILRCRADSGGFGRQSKTVPSTEATYHAVASLIELRKIL